MFKVKRHEKFATHVSGQRIRIVSAELKSLPYDHQYAVVVTLDKNGRRIAHTTRGIYIDSIRRKYAKV